MEEEQKQSSSCNDCCERVAWSSVVAATFSAVGVLVVVIFIGLSKSPATDLFADTYIATSVATWFSWLEIGAYVGMVLMVSLILLLLSMGCMATGYQNASSWCAFNKAQTGRRQLTAFLIVTYLINLAWYVFLIGSTLPAIFFYMADRGACSSSTFTLSTCLDLRQFGLAPQCLPGCSPSNQTTHLICGTNLVTLCNSNLLSNFFFTVIGCVLVLIGMNHFLMSLSGNYNWLRIRKRRQKLQAGQIKRRSGTYDVSSDAHEMYGNVAVDRQLSQDSNMHLRRVNFQQGSSTNILSSSSDSIPTVAAQVSTVPLTFAEPPATTWTTSSPSRRSPADVTSTTSSQYSAKIYNQTYGIDRNAIGQQQQQRSRNRVNFADSSTSNTTTSTTTPTWSTPTTTTHSSRGASNQNNSETDGGQGQTRRYDRFNPAFDENYWDHQYTDKQSKKSNNDYYSRGYTSNANQSSSTPSSYYGGGGNYNKGYYNYDYDVAEGRAGFEMKPTSTYGLGDSQQEERKPIGHNFFEYQL